MSAPPARHQEPISVSAGDKPVLTSQPSDSTKDDPLSVLEARRTRTLQSVGEELKLGLATLAIAGAALRLSKDRLHAIIVHLSAARHPDADRPALQHTIKAILDSLTEDAMSASVNGVNLLLRHRHDARDSDFVPIVSALAREASGDIMICPIDINRSVTALFSQADPGLGIIDAVNRETGISIAALDVSRLTGTPNDQTRIDRLVLQIEEAIVKVAAAASHLSIARSRINLQTSFMTSLTDAIADEPPTPVASGLDQLSAREAAIAIRDLLGKQQRSIANLNSQTVLTLLKGPSSAFRKS